MRIIDSYQKGLQLREASQALCVLVTFSFAGRPHAHHVEPAGVGTLCCALCCNLRLWCPAWPVLSLRMTLPSLTSFTCGAASSTIMVLWCMQDVSAIHKAKELAEAHQAEDGVTVPDYFIQIHQMKRARDNATAS